MFLRYLLVLLISVTGALSHAADLLPVIKQRFFDSNGDPLAGGKLYSYEAGTSTPKATYTTSTGLTANANPVVLDANGEASVYINAENYKFVLKNSSDVTQYTVDNVTLPSVSALASAFYRDVVYITSANSPYTIASTQNGKIISVDTTGGAVTINLPEISGLTLPFNIAIKRAVGASNSVTIVRAGTDTINLATSKVLDTLGGGVQLAADNDKSPDDWTVLDFGTVADAAITAAKLAYSSVNGQTAEPSVANDDELLLGDTSATALRKMTRSNFLKDIVRSVTSTDTATGTDQANSLSGASFTETLPAAASHPGKVLEFLHAGTSISQLYTIDGNGAETIGGALTFVLRFNGDHLRIRSDGSNWKILYFYSPGAMGSNYTAPLKSIIATLNCDGSSAITNQTGSTSDGISAIGNISAGACAVSFASGTFSTTPIHCEYSPIIGDGAGDVLDIGATGAATTSGVTVDCHFNSSTDCTAYDYTIMCTGPK